MPKRSSKRKRRSKALPALGFAGMSLSMASGACASTSEASANTSLPSQKHEIFLGEEEISDVSLATFYVFDKENAVKPQLGEKLAWGCRCGCRGCGGCRCGGCRCGVGCRCGCGFVSCVGCGGCGGCCLSWGRCGVC